MNSHRHPPESEESMSKDDWQNAERLACLLREVA